jgi:large subunit ribosomal protein L30
MSYFRITLLRSGIGLTKRTQGVLKALGLRHRMTTVFYPVTPEVAGQIMKVKELISVREVDRPLTREELKAERKPDHGFYMEKAMQRPQ